MSYAVYVRFVSGKWRLTEPTPSRALIPKAHDAKRPSRYARAARIAPVISAIEFRIGTPRGTGCMKISTGPVNCISASCRIRGPKSSEPRSGNCKSSSSLGNFSFEPFPYLLGIDELYSGACVTCQVGEQVAILRKMVWGEGDSDAVVLHQRGESAD